jgi:hypothetical protein
MFLKHWSNIGFTILISIAFLGSSTLPPGDATERVRAFTREIEFDYVAWTLDALQIKLAQLSLGAADYLPAEQRPELVRAYLDLVAQIQQAEDRLTLIFSDPAIADPQAASVNLRQELENLYARRRQLGPLAESVLQAQVSAVVASRGLSALGQPLPPVLYHSTPLPMALIVSPRTIIRQDSNISLVPDLPVDQQSALEDRVDRGLDVSSLVVGIGGVGVYPTMVMQTTDLNWLSEVVAHEWIHNFLTLRPLGVSYLNSPELRTMNETAAAIAGIEIGRILIETYYPDLAPPPPPAATPEPPQPPQPAAEPEPPAFDFRAEMRITRVTVDQLLAEEQVEQAEAYMEARRVFFWENGYRIRKLNQAYFSFYGAYADQPGGAAGVDPVGAAVRSLRASSPSLADFIKRISWMSTYAQLQKAIGESQ